MITAHDIENVIQKRGKAQEHLMFILRDLENLSGSNQLTTDVLKHVAEQTGLKFKTETRSVPVLIVERAKEPAHRPSVGR